MRPSSSHVELRHRATPAQPGRRALLRVADQLAAGLRAVIWFRALIFAIVGALAASSLRSIRATDVSGIRPNVEVTGATEQLAMVRWAVERFEIAGLDPPVVEIAFHRGLSRRRTPGPREARRGRCLHALVDPIARRALLHEMGHIWLDQNLSDPERERFLEVRGLHAWNESSDTWALAVANRAPRSWRGLSASGSLHHGSRTTTRSNWHVDSNCSPARRRRRTSMPATSRHPPHTRRGARMANRAQQQSSTASTDPYQERPATLRLLSARCPAPSARCGSRRKPVPPIAEYAFLSDRQVQALAAPSGNVEWLCLPRPDSPSVFGAMLDRSAGHFRLYPAEVTSRPAAAMSRGRSNSRRPGRRGPGGS